jgi:hypothetical protein
LYVVSILTSCWIITCALGHTLPKKTHPSCFPLWNANHGKQTLCPCPTVSPLGKACAHALLFRMSCMEAALTKLAWPTNPCVPLLVTSLIPFPRAWVPFTPLNFSLFSAGAMKEEGFESQDSQIKGNWITVYFAANFCYFLPVLLPLYTHMPPNFGHLRIMLERNQLSRTWGSISCQWHPLIPQTNWSHGIV